jgi:hypothetical protein
MNQRLLERIRSLETDSDQLESDDRAVEINSILKHLYFSPKAPALAKTHGVLLLHLQTLFKSLSRG